MNLLKSLCFLITLSLFAPTLAKPVVGTEILITGASKDANKVGVEIYKKGGNAIDAAVAVGLAMTVTNPFNASLGSGGFALINFKNKVEAIDFRETAPLATSPEYYLDKGKKASITGGTAVGVPGFAAGLYEIHKKHGNLKWEDLFEGALKLAEEGYLVNGEWVEKTERNKARFSKAGKKYFFKSWGRAYKPGDTFKQPQLASALKLLKTKQLIGFYEGAVAEDIAKTVNDNGGSFSLEDFKNYKIRWLKPIKAKFKGYSIYLMPPPSSGGVVIKTALTLMEKTNLHRKKPLSVDELHYLTEIMSRSFRGRALLGDPDFHKNPTKKLFSTKYVSELANSIRTHATKLEPLKEQLPQKESTQTTHFTVMDKKGNVVALTVTLNGVYGSGVVSEKFGITLNNEMDDFTTHPNEPNMFGLIQGQGNKVEPGKRPLSSMTPTIVKEGKKTVLALGAPGGPRIISGVLQTLYRVLANNFDMDFAIQYPRLHHQFLPNIVFADEHRLSPDVIKTLQAKGHVVKTTPYTGRVNGVRRNKRGWLEGAFDARGSGSVEGF